MKTSNLIRHLIDHKGASINSRMNTNETLMTLIFMISADLICEHLLDPCLPAGRCVICVP